jgi:hypothetical protein
MFILHDEPENASANATAKTVKRLALGTDMKGRRFFLMKWTERFEIRARALQREVSADDFNDIVGRRNLLDCLRRDHRL